MPGELRATKSRMRGFFDLLALILGGLGVIAVFFGFVAWSGARRNQDPNLPPSPFGLGAHGLNTEGREYARLFVKLWWFAVLMFLLGLLAASLGNPETQRSSSRGVPRGLAIGAAAELTVATVRRDR